MREDRLIERIRLREKEPARSATEDPKKVMVSVLRHLQKILNTRRGGVPIADDYGVPDFTDFMRVYPDALREVEKSIQNTIQKYEPRLTTVLFLTSNLTTDVITELCSGDEVPSLEMDTVEDS